MLKYNKRHAIIIPPKSRLCWLIMNQAHADTLHGGVQLMMAHIRNTYWVLHLRSELRQFTKGCVVCLRSAGITSQQLMADLPMARVRPARPFVKTGIDLAGPFAVRLTEQLNMATRSRSILEQDLKGYVVVFVCMVTRAVHLEAVMAISADAFLAAYKRFVARRGHCEFIYSDNGTNFVAANKELKLAVNTWQNSSIQDYCNFHGTVWTFITPSAPHQGGLWEAAVKQMKVHLHKVMGPQKYTYEGISTLVAGIEACMNSRPICAMSDDPEDLIALTPAHFIIGEPLKLPLPEEREEYPRTAITLYKRMQVQIQSFWRRWHNEYLSSLLSRPKWRESQANIKIGDLVLIKSENLAPTYWAMGRVQEVKVSDDGRVRSAKIAVVGGSLDRPIQKLIVLPKDEELKNWS